MKNDNKMDTNTVTYLKDILVAKKSSIEEFEEKMPTLKFDGENSVTWNFIVLKAFDTEFSYLMPLANHLLDYNYCAVNKDMTQFAALQGYQVEVVLNKMKSIQDNVNDSMKAFHFDEKLVVTNQPAENIYNLAKKIVNHANENDYQATIELFEKSGINMDNVKLLNRPAKSSLKM